MEAAHITWRPLGQLFVERGLITQEELEDALVEQRETRKRLGSILVGRGLVSGPELTSVLVDQLGMELTKESGFGSGLWDEIRRRHPRGRDRAESEPSAPEQPDDHAPFHDEQQHVPEPVRPLPLAPVQEAPPAPPAPPLPDPDRLQADLAKERAALAAALAEERAELQAALTDERNALEAALEEERAARQRALQERTELQAALSADRNGLEAALDEERVAKQQALQELVQSRADASARAEELGQLRREVEELRSQVEQSTRFAAVEQQARQERNQLEARLAALEASLVAERQAHSRAVEELEGARSEASVEAKELRSSIERVRAELERLDAATAWFEYWSGAASTAGAAREAQAEGE